MRNRWLPIAANSHGGGLKVSLSQVITGIGVLATCALAGIALREHWQTQEASLTQRFEKLQQQQADARVDAEREKVRQERDRADRAEREVERAEQRARDISQNHNRETGEELARTAAQQARDLATELARTLAVRGVPNQQTSDRKSRNERPGGFRRKAIVAAAGSSLAARTGNPAFTTAERRVNPRFTITIPIPAWFTKEDLQRYHERFEAGCRGPLTTIAETSTSFTIEADSCAIWTFDGIEIIEANPKSKNGKREGGQS